MPLKSGGALDNEYGRGRASLGLLSIGKAVANPYLGLGGRPGRIVKLESGSLTKLATLTMPLIETKELRGVRSIMKIVNNTLYFGSFTLPLPQKNWLIKVNLSDFTFEDSLELTPAVYTESPLWIEYVEPYLYVNVSKDPNSKLFKVDPASWSVVTSTTYTGERSFPCCVYMPSMGYLYGAFGFPRIHEIDPDDLSINRTLDLAGADAVTACMVTDGIYLYGVHYHLTQTRLIKVDPITMTRVSYLDLPSPNNYMRFIEYISPYLYLGRDATPGKILKVDPDTMTIEDSLELPSGENNCRQLAYKPPYLYVVLNTNPANCIKINPVTMTRIEDIDPPLQTDVEDTGWFITVP